MEPLSKKELIRLSRRKQRSDTENRILYDYISYYIKKKDYAFVLNLYKPFIVNTCYNFWKSYSKDVRDRLYFEDIIAEANFIFYRKIKKYDINKGIDFSTYFTPYLYFHLKSNFRKELKELNNTYIYPKLNDIFIEKVDKYQSSNIKVQNRLDSFLFIQEYTKIINNLKKENNPVRGIKTREQIIDMYFYQCTFSPKKAITIMSRTLNFTYHNIYQILSDILVKFIELYNENKYSNYVILYKVKIQKINKKYTTKKGINKYFNGSTKYLIKNSVQILSK